MEVLLLLSTCQPLVLKERKCKLRPFFLAFISNFSPRGSTDCFGAWFPSANPPDLPSVSPMDMKEIVLPNPTGSANLIPGVSYVSILVKKIYISCH